jgi:hypothetical protein
MRAEAQRSQRFRGTIRAAVAVFGKDRGVRYTRGFLQQALYRPMREISRLFEDFSSPAPANADKPVWTFCQRHNPVEARQRVVPAFRGIVEALREP